MADEENQDQPQPTSGGGKKTMLMVGAVMLVEAIAVYALVGFLGGGPSAASASEIEGLEQVDREAPVEVMLVDDRFQNLDSGRVWGWQAEVFLKTRKRNEETVNELLETHKAELREGVALIFRRARDRHLREPGMETIKHQISAYVADVFGTDEDDLPVIDDVIIAKLKGTPEDL